MSARWELTGLGSRVATRTFLIFAACLAIPAVLAALALNSFMTQEAQVRARDDLTVRAKSYGYLLFERIGDAEQDASRVADLVLANATSVEQHEKAVSHRFRILDIQRLAGGLLASTELTLISDASGAQPILTVTRSNGAASVTIRVQIDSAFLWNSEPIAAENTTLCVRHGKQVLHCTRDAMPKDSVRAEWPLYLRPSFGADAWTIEAAESVATATASLDSFKRTLPLATLAIVCGASLLTVIYLRRSHRPLATLAKAAEHIGRRQFDYQVTVESDDEFGKLAHVFNRMSANLGQQFGLMSLLARMDRMILRDPPIEELLQTTLPYVPALLRAHSVIVAVVAGNEVCLYKASRAHPEITISRLIGGDALLNKLLTKQTEASALDPFLANAKADRIGQVAIEVSGVVRGGLFFVNSSGAMRAGQVRHARAFASRFAVALGAADRRRTMIRQAYYDGLTGLANRQLFSDRLTRALVNARAQETRVALIYIDLDRFQTINDSLGHSAGDELIKILADRLSSLIRDSDTVARIGGDEFVIIAGNLVDHQLRGMAERIQNALREPLVIREVTCSVQASLGISVFPADAQSAEALLRNADIAANRAKSAGGGQIVFFEERMDRDAMHRLHLEQRLRDALERGRLQLAFQPKVRIEDLRIEGVEALARWTDEELGEVSPAVFIPIAEECGLIDALGEWALRDACTQFQQWRCEHIELDHISVNVSVRQLRNPDFVTKVLSVLESTSMPPTALEIEVTESTLAVDPAQVSQRLQQLRDLGVRVSIDDFGTGYSSLAAVCEMPADTLKIDRTFVKDAGTTSRAAAILEAIASMAHALGKTTVAEGVESLTQLDVLKRVGVDCVQGYLIAKPLHSASLLEFIRAHRTGIRAIQDSDDPADAASHSNIIHLAKERAR
jgi:diguanylate cyclase (GGDEF)-like protein